MIKHNFDETKFIADKIGKANMELQAVQQILKSIKKPNGSKFPKNAIISGIDKLLERTGEIRSSISENDKRLQQAEIENDKVFSDLESKTQFVGVIASAGASDVRLKGKVDTREKTEIEMKISVLINILDNFKDKYERKGKIYGDNIAGANRSCRSILEKLGGTFDWRKLRNCS